MPQLLRLYLGGINFQLGPDVSWIFISTAGDEAIREAVEYWEDQVREGNSKHVLTLDLCLNSA